MTTINRGPFNALVDDDGSGTTGTIWNKAAIQSVILDPADAAYSQAGAPPVVQTTTLTGTQNNFALTPNCRILRCNNTALLTLTGMSAGYDGQLVTIEAINVGQVDLAPNNAGSTTKFLNWVSSGPTSLAAASGSWYGGTATYEYAGGAGLWRLVAHEQGAWINVPFNASNFSSSSGTCTVESGDLLAYRYFLIQRTLHISLTISGASLSANTTYIYVTIPTTFTGATASDGVSVFHWANPQWSTLGFGTGSLTSGTSTLTLTKDSAGTQWIAGTNTLYITGQFITQIA